jgi:transcriptional regulator with XRE-family HTH domain
MPMAAAAEKPLELVLTRLGLQLRDLRTRRGWTLAQLSKLSGLSEPYLSRLESGSRQPSLAALLTLAEVYKLSIPSLLERQAAPSANTSCTVIRAAGASTRSANGLHYRPVSGSGSLVNLRAIQVTVPLKRRNDHLYQHDGEEWLYVLGGRLRLVLAGEDHLLNPGDAAHFDARTPHRLAAEGDCAAQVLLVAAASPRPLLSLAHR